MPYQPQNYDHLLGLPGFSDQLLKNHFTLYQGYVANTNKLADAIAAMVKDNKQATPEFAELKRRFGWEFNGMRLHELYFRCLSKTPKAVNKDSALFKQIVKDFGSFENWEKEMKAICAMRGIGWAVLYYDIFSQRLHNVWINEHDVGHLATSAPLLVIDVFEHAFMIDYQLKRADYVEAVFKVINWDEVGKLGKLVGLG
jgi:Fe-Mn family superoxide dismutase